MKKLLSVILILCMVFVIAACGGNASSDTSQAADVPNEGTEADASENTSSIDAENADEVSFERGTVTDNTYENDLFGFSATLDNNWHFFDDEEIASVMGTAADMLTDESLSDSIQSGATVCDFYAMNSSDVATMNLQVSQEDNGLSAVAASKLSEQTVVDNTYDEIVGNGMDQTLYDSIGLKDGSIEKSTVKFSGADRPCIRVSGIMVTDNGELPFYETMVFFVAHKYTGTLTIAAYGENNTDTILEAFTLK